MSRRVALSLWMLAALLVVTTLTASGIGALRLPVSLLWNGTDEALRQIWLTIRLPRVLLALAIGGSLALAGCVMQGLFRNPLADPGLLGISSGAALAVALWVVLPLSLPALVMLYAPMLAAFLGALAATFVIFLLSRQRDASLSRLLLVGIAINALCGAAVGVLSWLSNDAQLRQLSLWGMGSLGRAVVDAAGRRVADDPHRAGYLASGRAPQPAAAGRRRGALSRRGGGRRAADPAAVQRPAGGCRRCDQRRDRFCWPGGAAPGAHVAGSRPSGHAPRLGAGRCAAPAGGRHAGAQRGRSGGNAGWLIDQPSRRAVVPVADLSSWRCAWLNAIVQKTLSFAPGNAR